MNPFVRYDLDPHQSPRELTEQLRERMEDATSEGERDELRAAWELLTKKPTERAFLSLEAGPDLRPVGGLVAAKRPLLSDVRDLDALPTTFIRTLSQDARARVLALTDPALGSYEVRKTERP